MYHRTKEPDASHYHLCWEPTLEEGRKVWEALDAGNIDGPVVKELIAHLEAEIDTQEMELRNDVQRYKERKAAAEIRSVNEKQLQEAVSFLERVWKGEITDATMEQIAAARCFMRAGEDY